MTTLTHCPICRYHGTNCAAHPPRLDPRTQRIWDLVQAGATYQQAAEPFDISRDRARYLYRTAHNQ